MLNIHIRFCLYHQAEGACSEPNSRCRTWHLPYLGSVTFLVPVYPSFMIVVPVASLSARVTPQRSRDHRWIGSSYIRIWVQVVYKIPLTLVSTLLRAGPTQSTPNTYRSLFNTMVQFKTIIFIFALAISPIIARPLPADPFRHNAAEQEVWWVYVQ